MSIPSEPRKKKPLLLSIESWLVNRDPYNGIIPTYLGSISSPTNPLNNHLLTQPMDHEKKSLNFIFPTKYVIPKSLKFSHWLSEFKVPFFIAHLISSPTPSSLAIFIASVMLFLMRKTSSRRCISKSCESCWAWQPKNVGAD